MKAIEKSKQQMAIKRVPVRLNPKGNRWSNFNPRGSRSWRRNTTRNKPK